LTAHPEARHAGPHSHPTRASHSAHAPAAHAHSAHAAAAAAHPAAALPAHRARFRKAAAFGLHFANTDTL
jgi:hypothetical protein